MDAGARLIREAAGPVVTDPASPLFEGAVAGAQHTAMRHAIAVGLQMATASLADARPLSVRAEPRWLPMLAGLCDTTADADSASRLRVQWHLTMRDRALWLSGYRPNRTCWWGDRVNALARFSGGLVVGTPPGNLWAALPTRPDPLPGAGDSCPICLEDFDDPLPRPDVPVARASDSLFQCARHASCISCETSRPLHRCPSCRADRAAWLIQTRP